MLICSHTNSPPHVCEILILPEIELLVESIVPLNSMFKLSVLSSLHSSSSDVSNSVKLFSVRVAIAGPETVVSVTVIIRGSLITVVVNPEQLV